MANIAKKVRAAQAVGKVKAYMPAHYKLKLMKVSKARSYNNEYGEGHYDLDIGDPILEGTRGEHWSPDWQKKIVEKYLLANGNRINPAVIPFDEWVDIQTNPDPDERRKSITWAVDAELISNEPFEVNGLTINPAIDMLCMSGDETSPSLEYGCWPVKKDIFRDTYEELK